MWLIRHTYSNVTRRWHTSLFQSGDWIIICSCRDFTTMYHSSCIRVESMVCFCSVYNQLFALFPGYSCFHPLSCSWPVRRFGGERVVGTKCIIFAGREWIYSFLWWNSSLFSSWLGNVFAIFISGQFPLDLSWWQTPTRMIRLGGGNPSFSHWVAFCPAC